MFNNSNYKSINSLKCFSLMSFEELRYNDMILKKLENYPSNLFLKKVFLKKKIQKYYLKKSGKMEFLKIRKVAF